MWTKYEKEVYQFLSVYRFLSYGLAVMFAQVPVSLLTPQIPDLQLNIILGALGVYTLLRVFSPLRWREGSVIAYTILIGDFLLCISLVVFTNGLNSIFLLYSLTPIMSAALFFEERIALSLAATATVVLSLSYLLVGRLGDRIASLMQGYNLTLLIVYTLFSFVGATVPYRINLNIRRRIEKDAIIEERRRIGREIHDGVAQSLSYLNMKTKLVRDSVSARQVEEALSGLEDIRITVQDTYDDVRESIDQLSTEARNLPLVPALRDYIDDFNRKNSLSVQLRAQKAFPRVSPVAELQLLRIAQEALTNIRKHAEATYVAVRLERNGGDIELIVQDNGRGFDLAGYEKSSYGSHGLNIIKERAEGLGGTLSINTAPGKGTEVKVSVPVEKVRL